MSRQSILVPTQKLASETNDQSPFSKEYLNDTVILPIQVDSSVTKTSRKRYAINNHISRNSLDLGQYNQSKLSHLYESSYEQQQRGSIVCLAELIDNKVMINQQSLNLFNKYQKNQITFIGNYGLKGSGKSFWYDKILNLSEVEGSYYSKNNRNPGLYIWSIPFIKNNLRIFLIDFYRTSKNQNLTTQDQKLLDLQLILSQAIVLLPNFEDKKLKIVDIAYNDFNQSMEKLRNNGSKTKKQTEYWPHSVYNLYRSTKPVNSQSDKLSYLFKDYNYSIIHNAINLNAGNISQQNLLDSSIVAGDRSCMNLNDKYIKRTSLVFKNIYEKLQGKKYSQIKYSGFAIPFILKHFAQNVNSPNDKQVSMNEMFDNIKKQIYDKKLLSGQFIYNVCYQQLRDQKPRPLDEVLDVLKKTDENALASFNSSNYNPNLHKQYEEKLLKYGQQMQKEVLQLNEKKTYQHLSKTLPNLQVEKQKQLQNFQILDFLNRLKTQNQELDHNRAKPVKEKLKDFGYWVQKFKYFHVIQTERYYNKKKLQINIFDKKKQLKEIQSNIEIAALLNNHSNAHAQDLLEEGNKSQSRIDQTRSQLNLSKRKNKNAVADQDYIKELEKNKKELQDLIINNDKKVKQLNNLSYIDDPRLSVIRQKLDDKKALELQIEAGGSQSNYTNRSLLASRKSQIRKIQPQRKNSYIHKSMTK